MAEFNATAFSAVDSFFVLDKEGASHDPLTIDTNLPNHGNKRRLGLGAVATLVKPSATAPTQLMKIGNKRRNREDDEEAEIIPDIYDEEDDEEDVGRTGIATQVAERKEPDDTKSGSMPTSKKTKKKADKKERQQMREKEHSKNQLPSVDDAAGNGNQQERELTTKTTDEENPKETLSSQQKQKRKRRKVRSRQKNIYKDNRVADNKPDHLIPGGFEYKGRPITAETRAKLAKKQGVTNSDGNPSTNNEWKSSHWLDDDAEGQGDSGVPIFQASKPIMGATMDRSSRVDEVKNRRTPKEDKKQKKPRYKNIQ